MDFDELGDGKESALVLADAPALVVARDSNDVGKNTVSDVLADG